MAIQIGGTTVIDNSRNIQNIGIATADSFKGSAQVGFASGGIYIGLTTQFNFVGSGVTHVYNATSGVTTITFSSSGGSGGSISIQSATLYYMSGI